VHHQNDRDKQETRKRCYRLVVPGRDASVRFESAEEAFDHVALAIHSGVNEPRVATIALAGDHGPTSPSGNSVDKPIAVVGLVANNGHRAHTGSGKQSFGLPNITALCAGETHGQQSAARRNSRMDLCPEATPASAERLVLLAACRPGGVAMSSDRGAIDEQARHFRSQGAQGLL